MRCLELLCSPSIPSTLWKIQPRCKTQLHGSFPAGMLSPELPAGGIGAGGLWGWPRRAPRAQPGGKWPHPAPSGLLLLLPKGLEFLEGGSAADVRKKKNLIALM